MHDAGKLAPDVKSHYSIAGLITHHHSLPELDWFMSLAFMARAIRLVVRLKHAELFSFFSTA